MTRPIVVRALADADIDAALDHYAAKAPQVVGKLLSALRTTIASIGKAPAAGSPRYAQELDLPGLRHKRTRGFPYLVFYIAGPRDISVLRVLHEGRDIPDELEKQ